MSTLYAVRTQGPAIAALLLSFLFSQIAHAYTNWEWKVIKLETGSQTITGPSTTFNTKTDALAALRALHIHGSVLSKETVSTFDTSGGWVEYTYDAPTVDPNFGDWTYYWAYLSPAFSEVIVPGTYTSEVDVLTAITSAHVPSAYCSSTELEVVFDWIDWPHATGTNASTHDERTYRVNDPPGYQCATTVYVHRVRTITCPAGYSLFSWAGPPPPICTSSITGSIKGRPIECSASGPSTLVGNPCDAATGDKSQTEVDYSKGGLAFIRHYHSATLESRGLIGIGWTHNYAARLLKSSPAGVPRGLLRPSGYQDSVAIISGEYISLSGAGIRVYQNGTQWIASLRDGSKEIYDDTGKLIQLVSATGALTSLNYDAQGYLESVVGPFGHSLQFAYTNGLISSVTDPAGNAISYSYDGNSDLTQVSYQDGKTRTFHYENASFPNHLTGITDEDGVRYATYGYDSSGRATSSVHAGGADQTTIVYNSTNSVVTDAADATTTYAFTTDSSLSRRVLSVSKNGLTTTYLVPGQGTDKQRRVTQETDPRGIVTAYTYNSNRLQSRTDAVGTSNERTTAYQYLSSTSVLPTEITKANRATSFAYDSSGNVLMRTITDISATPNVSRTWTWTYNSYGQILTEDGPRTDVADVTTYTYYSPSTTCAATVIGASAIGCRGQLETITDALDHVTSFNEYNAHGQPLTITDLNGVLIALTYDARQRLTSRTVGGETTSYAYRPTGLLKRVTLPDVSYLEYTYDAAHRLTQVNDAEGNHVVYTLDAMGNRTAENVYDPSSALTQARTRVFNTLNQLSEEIGAAGGPSVTTTLGYDNSGNMTSIEAPLGRDTTNVYDELNRLIQVTDPANGITQFGYNALDQLISVTDPRSLVTSYSYNALGDLKQQVSPDTGTTIHTYDSGGNLKTAKDARNKTGTYTYDALNRVTSLAYNDQTITYTYDGGVDQKGRLTELDSSGATVSWTYDGLGRVLSKTQVANGNTKTIAYQYNSVGQLEQITTPSGKTVAYGYSNGKISSISVNGTTVLSNVVYEPFGPVGGWTWGNSTLAVRTYDLDGRTSQVDSAGLRTYDWDDASRITGIQDAQDASLDQAYGYDDLDRLTSVTKASGNQAFTYDANGNRLSYVDGAASSTYTLDTVNNRLTGITGSQARTYTYNPVGNVTAYNGITLAYSDRERIKSATIGGVEWGYYIDGLGQRVRKKLGPGGNHFYVYDEAGRLVGEYNGNSLIQETVWLGDIPVATLRKNGGGFDIYYVHTDHLNAPIKVTRPSDNAVRWRWDRDPFGTAAPDENPSGLGAFSYNLRLPGQFYDDETDLNYNYFRDYDPAIGRYVESDPIGLVAGINTYIYADGNPLLWSDPLGLEVLYCKAPAQIAGGLVNHVWLKTDAKEAGMDALRNLGRHDSPPAGDAYDFLYLTEVGIVEHTGDSANRAGATCETVDNVDENRVNEMLEIGKSLGRFSLMNNCTTFAYHVLANSRIGARPIPDPHRALSELVRRGAKGRDL